MFTIDLNVNPKDRWKEVTRRYCHLWPLLMAKMENQEGTEHLKSVLEGHLTRLGRREDWMDEMRGIAEHSNGSITFDSLVNLNLSYELTEECGCTSIVSRRSDGTIYLARTLDWMWTDILRSLTIQVRFVRGKKELFTASTIAGYVGVLTGVRKRLSVSINYRQDVGDIGSTDDAWPIGFLVRHVMTSSQDCDYQMAKRIFSRENLWSPCYVIMAGGHGEGCIITRGSTFVEKLENLEESSSSSTRSRRPKVLIQTNIDNEKVMNKTYPDFMRSKDRYKDVKEFLETTSNGLESDMWDVLMLKSVWDHDTVFGTVMKPDTNEMETRYNNNNSNISSIKEMKKWILCDLRVGVVFLALMVMVLLKLLYL